MPATTIDCPARMAADTGAPAARALTARALPFRRYSEVEPLLAGLEGTVFQSRHWLETWLEIFAVSPEVEPFLALVEDGEGRIVLALPLVRRRAGRLRVIEFADLAVSDYAAPLIRRAGAAALASAPALWDLLRACLPPADLLRFERLAPRAAGLENPLYAHPLARPNRLSGWMLDMGERWEDCARRMTGSQRGRFEKFRRKLAEIPDAAMTTMDDPAGGLEALRALTALQAERLSALGQAFHFTTPPYDAFYEALVRRGVGTGETMLCAIRARGEWVAVNFGVRAGDQIVYLRLGNRLGEWARLAPGVALTEMMMREAQARGVRMFDFGMGTYEYKRRLGGIEMPLRDLVLPLSLRGLPAALRWHARHWLSRNPLLRRLTGRAPLGKLPGAGE